MNKSVLFRLIAVGVPVLVGIVVSGIILRKRNMLVVEEGTLTVQAPPLYVEEPGHEKTGHRYLYDEQLGWRNIPSWSATTFGKPLNTNSKHLRDREYSFAKPVGTKRILVLGDSFAWGYGVGDDEIFTEVLEERLVKQESTWEVLNTGVSGWGTDQQYLYFRSEGKRYEPDIVVVAFYLGNDPVNCARSIQYGLNKPVFTDMALTLKNVPVPRPPTDSSAEITSPVPKQLLVVRILEALADECEQNGARLVLMKFGVFQQPNAALVKKVDADFRSKLKKIESRIEYLDLDAAFDERGFTRQQLTEGVDDGHWNPFGHRMTAEILQDFLSSKELLP